MEMISGIRWAEVVLAVERCLVAGYQTMMAVFVGLDRTVIGVSWAIEESSLRLVEGGVAKEGRRLLRVRCVGRTLKVRGVRRRRIVRLLWRS